MSGRQRLTRELLFGAFVGPQSDKEDPRVRERIIASIEERDCEPGDVLFAAGEVSTHVHFMTEGQVRMVAEGRPDWVYRGDWVIGTTDVLARRVRARSAIAASSMRTFRLHADHWFDVMRDRPAALLNTITGFVRGTNRYYERLAPDGGWPVPSTEAPLASDTITRRLLILREVGLLRGAPAQLLLELAAVAEVRELHAGDVVFTRGSAPALVVVTRGTIDVARHDPDVRGSFGPGSAVGGPLGLGDLRDGAWTATAREAGEVLVVPAETLWDALEDHAEGMRAMMTTLALEQERLWELLAERTGELELR